MATNIGFQGFAAKTAAYTIVEADNGTTFTNRGASGSVTLTLPAVAANLYFRFIVQAAQALVVAAPTVDTLIAYNDAAADSVESNTVGALIEVFCDGTSWYALGTTNGVTYTVNT